MSRKKKKTLKMKMRKGMHTGERVRSLERCRWWKKSVGFGNKSRWYWWWCKRKKR